MKLRSWFLHLKDFGLNTIAFGIYIMVQQLVIMPMLSKTSNVSTFSKIIFFISIFNIVSSVIGDELGNTRLVRANAYKDKNFFGDFNVILLILIINCLVICVFLNVFIKINWLDLIFYLLITALGIIRYFSMSYYKLKQHFTNILVVNVFYCLGSLAGVYAASKVGFYIAPFLLGEVFSCIYVAIMLLKDEDQKLTFRTTPELYNSMKVYGQLGTVSIISNFMAYMDRIIIYLMLGPTAMAVYYSASAMSKMICLVINPISVVILAKLTSVSDTKKFKIISILIKLLIPLFLIFLIGSVILSYLGVRMLYPDYFDDATNLLLPIGIATSLSLISLLMKPVIMRFSNIKELLFVQILYAIIFCSSMYFFSKWWGIVGYAWAGCLAQLTQSLSFSLMILKSRTVEGELN